MPHIRKNGQPCPGRPFQEATTMGIMCSTCREPVGPPPAASAKPKTIASSPQGVNEMLRRRLHPETAEAPSPYAESIAASQSDAFSLIRKKTQEKAMAEQRKLAEVEPAPENEAAAYEASGGAATAVAEKPQATSKKVKTAAKGKRGRPAKAKVHVQEAPPMADDDLLTADDEPTVAPVALPPSPSADVVTTPLADTPPLMAAINAAAAAGNASK